MVSGVPRSLRLRATRPAAVWYRCIRVWLSATENGTAQCKKYAEFTVDNFKDAVAEFEKELNRWQRRNVKQFRLFVACPCADTKVLDEVHSATERLLQKGIEFEFLDGHRLVGQLRRYPELVSQYIGVHWVEVLCGGRSASTLIGTRKGDVLSGLGLNDFVLAEWQSDRSRELDEIREKFRCGHVFNAYNHLRAFAQSPAWDSLSGEVRALALRVLASMELDRCGDVDAARRWIAIARKADPFGNFRIIDALIAYHEHGVDAAIETLGYPQNVDAWNLLLSLRLAKGESAAVLAELDAKPFELNSESLRVQALALLLQKRLGDAEASALASAVQQPEWSGIRQTQAVVRYAATICPDFHAWGYFTWPIPPERSFIKTDDDSITKLRAAADAFARILQETPEEAPDRADLETWKLATLANDAEAQDEAERFAQSLIKENPGHYRAIIWATERGYDFDRVSARAALAKLAKDANADLDAVNSGCQSGSA